MAVPSPQTSPLPAPSERRDLVRGRAADTAGFSFDNSYVRALPGFYVRCTPHPVPQPRLVFFNAALAEELGLQLLDVPTQAAIFSGKALPTGAEPIAQAYAGHQFGRYSPQLGDGRALLMGEVIDRHGRRRDIAFKGSGRTPFSRGGDGKATLGPMLREVLIGEAMHALGIPTTRGLAVVGTGESVFRSKALPGAMLTRVATSHVRVGTFEYFAARGAHAQVQQLADYTIARHDPELMEGQGRYLAFLRAVARRQAALLAQWMGVGFIHGVMNTDNMSIAGETIDFGPCAFMEAYNPQAVFSSIDENGRYAFAKQPGIAQWNLARLAEALLPLLADDADQAVTLATEVVEAFADMYRQRWLAVMRAKLGLRGRPGDGVHEDVRLAEDWLDLLQEDKVDFTLAWRSLADAAAGDLSPLRALFANQQALDAWLARWQERCLAEDREATEVGRPGSAPQRAQAMRRVNPWLIPRNHRVEEALVSAEEEGDLAPFEQLLAALRQPYAERPEWAGFAAPASAAYTAGYRTFCGT